MAQHHLPKVEIRVRFPLVALINMKTLVVYSSKFGNTAKIARSIAKGVTETVSIIPAKLVNTSDVKGITLFLLKGF